MLLRIVVVTVVIAAAAFAAAVVVALVAWPQPRLASADAALARVVMPGYSGSLASVELLAPGGARVPVALRDGRLWPQARVNEGERLEVRVTVRRPFWAGWLLGGEATSTFTVEAPRASLRATWLQVTPGQPVRVAFDAPVSVLAIGGHARGLAQPASSVATGVVASGANAAGAVEVSAAPRLWESLPPPALVRWFPASKEPVVLAEPRPGGALAPGGSLTLTFSRPVSQVLGGSRPDLSPAVPGSWSQLDSHTLRFAPAGAGFGLGTLVQVGLPQAVTLAGAPAGALTRTLSWQVPVGSILRLQQLLAQLGYLPLRWQAAASGASRNHGAQLAAALRAPPGHFSWRYANTPPSLESLWQAGSANTITQGAVMMFEQANGLAVDGIAGPEVWKALIAAALGGQGRRASFGYAYVYVHRSLPQSLNLWVDGHTILSSPGNTGVPAAPTALGTFPVFEHIPVGTMKGTNPDGSHYDDPGIRWISYFHGGDAIHSFNRASFGTPQSLGCVELPLSAAAQVYPYTPIGTLVTIEN